MSNSHPMTDFKVFRGHFFVVCHRYWIGQSATANSHPKPISRCSFFFINKQLFFAFQCSQQPLATVGERADFDVVFLLFFFFGQEFGRAGLRGVEESAAVHGGRAAAVHADRRPVARPIETLPTLPGPHELRRTRRSSRYLIAVFLLFLFAVFTAFFSAISFFASFLSFFRFIHALPT